MSGILFLCHRMPYPPNKGDKIRSYHILNKLKSQGDVYLGTLIDDPLDWDYVNQVNQWVVDSCIKERRSLKRHWPHCLIGMMQGKPLSNVLFYSPQLQLWVDSLIKTNRITKIYLFSSVMAQYVLPYANQIQIITDFVDVDSQKWSQYASTRWFPLNLLYKLEAKRLARFEQKVANVSRASLFVSRQEVALFNRTSSNKHNRVLSVENGVDTDFFMPTNEYHSPYQGTHKKILFTGLMDYWPNVEAVTWFVKEVFSRLIKQDESVVFYIVGANPSKAVFKLSGSRVIVTGRVPDMRPYLKHADIVVAPLQIARGIQNKVLEAMSMRKQIVATPQALEGIQYPQGARIYSEQKPKDWLRTIQRLLHEPAYQSFDTHAWVKQNYSWDANLRQIDDIWDQKKIC